MSSLTYGLRSWKDLYEKLKRDAELLEDEVTSDRLFNFVITAYHLCDWVGKASEVPETIRVCGGSAWKNKPISICRDIADASKHFGLNRKPGTVDKVESQRACGTGRFGKGAYGVGEEGITLTLSDNLHIKALSFKNEVLNFWHDFFCKNSLIP